MKKFFNFAIKSLMLALMLMFLTLLVYPPASELLSPIEPILDFTYSYLGSARNVLLGGFILWSSIAFLRSGRRRERMYLIMVFFSATALCVLDNLPSIRTVEILILPTIFYVFKSLLAIAMSLGLLGVARSRKPL